ncbi:hypothetical protein KSP40_PGU006661 [Platanthera guangdongensis]|uniref:Citrate transporter-like domain-containing protein n=1 Tax=Platanthera guangdongensis TaxID=2320717 RepID=A0ABR2MMM2_9ASPA
MVLSCSIGSHVLLCSHSTKLLTAAIYPPSPHRSIERFRLQIYPRFPHLPTSSSFYRPWKRTGVIAMAEEETEGSLSLQQGKDAGVGGGVSRGEYKELLDRSAACDPICSVDEVTSQDFKANYQPKTDLLKALTILLSALVGATAINHSWVAANQDASMALFFVLGYAGIIFEESLAFNKSGVAILMAVCLWVIRSIGVGFVTFFLSSVLDNLTSTIVMVSLLRKLVPPSEYRRILGAVVVIAANAGGAWTPIGDITTTMLWIHGQISTLPTMKGLFIPSVVSLAVPLGLMSLTSKWCNRAIFYRAGFRTNGSKRATCVCSWDRSFSVCSCVQSRNRASTLHGYAAWTGNFVDLNRCNSLWG